MIGYFARPCPNFDASFLMTGPATYYNVIFFTTRAAKGWQPWLNALLLWEDWTEESVLARKRDMDEGSKRGWQARALMTAEAVIRRWMCGARGFICFLLVLSAVVSFLDAAVPLRCGGVGFADLGVLCLLVSGAFYC